MQKTTRQETGCPCCREADSRVWVDEGRGTQYRLCCECGTVFASPMAAREDRIAAFAARWGKESAIKMAKLRYAGLELIARLIQRYKNRGRLLDCGCSSGAFFRGFDKARWELYGVELSPTAAAHAASATGATVYAGTLQSAQFPSDHFDLLTIIDTFYYFDDPSEQLQEAARLLKADGILAIEIPGARYSRVRSRGLVCLLLSRKWYRLASDSTYLFIYSWTGFKRLVEEAGFEFVQFESVPSPRTSWFANLLGSVHFAFMRKLIHHHPDWVDWSPKVLWIFRKKQANHAF